MVEEFRRAIISWSDGFTRINFEMARSLIALRRPEEAILYLSRTEIHELLAQAFAAQRQRDSAAAHYRAVVAAWQKADPQFQPRLQPAKTWLAVH